MVARTGEAAGFGFLVHSHMLRHGCGFKLAADGQDTRAIQAYLGHRSIQSTVRYTHWRLIGSKISGRTSKASTPNAQIRLANRPDPE
jgi:integrase